MNETIFDWDDIKLFLAVARHRGLSAAARETGTSAPTLGRRMLRLETKTRKELFERHARGYSLTEVGEAFFVSAQDIEARIKPLTARSEQQQKTVVKISAGAWTTRAIC